MSLTGSGERTAAVRLTVNATGLTAGLAKARQQLQDLGKDAAASAAKSQASWEKVGKGFAVVGVAAGAALGLAVKKSMDFEAAMSGVKAATQASGATLEALKQTALNAGAATQYSATEAADAITAMAKAGVRAGDIMGGGLTGALNLAAAGQMGVADAADIAATALTQFKLQGKDLPHVADLLAAGAGKAQGSVADLGNALKYVGPVAAGMGVSIDETVGVLAEFASQGIIGEQAGTSFRGMLASLSSPSKQAKDELDRLGISLYDGQGKFVGMQGAADALQQGLGGLTDQQRDASLGIIFGNQQLTAARVLYQGGAEAVKHWTGEVNAAGYAAKQAGDLTNNLRGDLERLGGAFDTALISSGSKANGVLRDMTQAVTGVVDVYNDLPQGAQTAATSLVGVVSAVGLTGGALIGLAPRIQATKTALGEMGKTGALLQRGLAATGSVLLGPWGLAIGAGVLALGYFAQKHAEAVHADEQLRGSLDQTTGAITDQTTAMVAQRLQAKGTFERFGFLAGGVDVLTQAALGNADALGQLRDKQAAVESQMAALVAKHGDLTGAEYDQLVSLQAQSEGFKGLFGEIGAVTGSLGEQMIKQRELATATAGSSAAAEAAAGPMDTYGAAVGDVGGAADDTATTVSKLTDAFDVLFGRTYSVQEATDSYFSSLNALTESVTQNGKSLKGNSAAAIENRGKLRDIASSADDVIGKMVEQGASYEDVVAKTKTLKAAYDEHARKAHITGAEVKQVDDYLDQLPGTYKAQIQTSGVPQAKEQVSGLIRTIAGLRDKRVDISVVIGTQNKLNALGARLLTPATGGYISGPGTGTSDSIPALVSNGEYVVNAAATAKHRSLLDGINAGRYANGGIVRALPQSGPHSQYERFSNEQFSTMRFSTTRFFDGYANRPTPAPRPQPPARIVNFNGPLGVNEERIVHNIIQRLREEDSMNPHYDG